MMSTEMRPIVGCWISQRLPDGSVRTGVVEGQLGGVPCENLKVKWRKGGDGSSVVPAQGVRSGFVLGMEVQDAAPDLGSRSIGIGMVMQLRELAGFEQVLVDFPESGEKRWLPFQYLRQVKGARHRFMTGDTGCLEDAEKMRLRILAHAIEAWQENTGALSHMDIDPLPHQIHLVHHILASGNYSWLIADDVGLGKTIETGMLIAALRQRDLARRVLLITPAGLTRQWKDELYYKFKLGDFEIYGEDFVINEPRSWKLHDCVIGSMDRLKQEANLELLLQAGVWDLVIVDEGHRLSRRQYGQKLDTSDRYELAAAIRPLARHMLLLSATPHQGMQDKFVALLELLRPERKQELLAFAANPEILRDMVYRNHKADVTDAEGNFIFRGKVTRAIKVPLGEAARAFDGRLQDYLRQGYAAGAAMGQKGNAIGFVMTVYRKLAASSSAAIHQALCRRLARLQREWREQLIEQGSEWDERYRGEWEEQFSGESLEFFEGETELLKQLIADAERLRESDLKKQQFIEEVMQQILDANGDEKVLIFTEYRTTQDYLRQALESTFGAGKVEVINGSMAHGERKDAIARFEGQGQFLISTEAGGEGINLQRRCHIMVNYDLPWNPMRLVQRIGRLYRYGQRNKVVVFNIHAPGSLDQNIIDLMYARIESVVSDMASVQRHEFNERLSEEILGEMAELVDVEDILRDATMVGLDRTKERIDEALARAREATAKQRDIFEHAAGFTPSELKDELVVTRAHMEAFVVGMFDQLGIEVIGRSFKNGLLRIRLPESVMRDIGLSRRQSAQMEVTLDRDLAMSRPSTHMLDLSSHLMQYLIDKARSYPFGGLSAALESYLLPEGVVASALLRWQDPQGRRMRKEFVMAQLANGVVKINPPALGKWLLQQVEAGAVQRVRHPVAEECREAVRMVEEVLKDRLRRASSRYLHPESLQWTTAALVGGQ